MPVESVSGSCGRFTRHVTKPSGSRREADREGGKDGVVDVDEGVKGNLVT